MGGNGDKVQGPQEGQPGVFTMKLTYDVNDPDSVKVEGPLVMKHLCYIMLTLAEKAVDGYKSNLVLPRRSFLDGIRHLGKKQ